LEENDKRSEISQTVLEIGQILLSKKEQTWRKKRKRIRKYDKI